MEVAEGALGTTASGARVRTWTLRGAGVSVVVTDLGATVLQVNVPDGAGGVVNVAPCHQSVSALEAGLARNPKMGATCGRVCNRTCNARFELDGAEYALRANEGAHHIHGGEPGWDMRVWSLVGTAATPAFAAVTLAYDSPAGEEGYPGAVEAVVDYTLSASNELTMEFRATTDKATPINMCKCVACAAQTRGVGRHVDVRVHAVECQEARVRRRERRNDRRVVRERQQAVRAVERLGGADARLEACSRDD